MSENFCEYIIKQKNEGAALVKRVILISLYVLIFAIPFSLALLNSSAEWFIPIILVSAAVDSIFIFITWRFMSLEYEYIIDMEDITVSKIWGGRIRKRILTINIEKISEIGLYDDAAYENICKMSIQQNHVCVSSLSAPVMYYAVYSVEKDQCILYFEATDEGISLLKKRNSAAFRTAEKRLKSNTSHNQ